MDQTKQNEEVVDVTQVIEELRADVNKLSVYCFSLLRKINDLYIRLEINSKVIEECIYKLGMDKEEYASLVRNCVTEVKKVVDKSPLFQPDQQQPQA